jgi:HPP family
MTPNKDIRTHLNPSHPQAVEQDRLLLVGRDSNDSIDRCKDRVDRYIHEFNPIVASDCDNAIEPSDPNFNKLKVWVEPTEDRISSNQLSLRSDLEIGSIPQSGGDANESNDTNNSIQDLEQNILAKSNFSRSIIADIDCPATVNPPRLSTDRRKIYRQLKVSVRKSHRRGRMYQPKFSFAQGMISWAGSLIGIEALVYLSTCTHYPLMAAPFGATAVLVYGVPDSPLSQPRNIIGGNCIGALVSIVLTHYFGAEPWVMGLAVAMSLKLMKLTRTLHPPGGAIALVGVMSHASWSFLLTPALVGSLIIVSWTLIFNNIAPGRSYPRHWL